MLSFYLSLVETEEERDLVTELYSKYERDMYSVAYGILHNKHDAEDAVSEAFIRIIKNLHRFTDKSCPKSKGYFVIIIRNISYDMIKSQKRSEMNELTPDIAAVNSAEDDYLETVISGDIAACCRRIPEKYRSVLILYALYDLSKEEISEVLNISIATTRKRLFRARNMLNNLLEENKDNSQK